MQETHKDRNKNPLSPKMFSSFLECSLHFYMLKQSWGYLVFTRHNTACPAFPSPLCFLLLQEHWSALSPSEMLVYLKPDLHALTYSCCVSYFSDLLENVMPSFTLKPSKMQYYCWRKRQAFLYINNDLFALLQDRLWSSNKPKNKRKPLITLLSQIRTIYNKMVPNTANIGQCPNLNDYKAFFLSEWIIPSRLQNAISAYNDYCPLCLSRESLLDYKNCL